MNMLENTGHLWSPFHAFMDEQIEVSGTDAPLGTELRRGQFSGLNPTPDSLAGDTAESRHVVDSHQCLRDVSRLSHHVGPRHLSGQETRMAVALLLPVQQLPGARADAQESGVPQSLVCCLGSFANAPGAVLELLEDGIKYCLYWSISPSLVHEPVDLYEPGCFLMARSTVLRLGSSRFVCAT